MNTMVKAPPGTCPAPVCGRDEIDLNNPTRVHRMEGNFHTWSGVNSVIVMDCRTGLKSVYRVPRVVES